MTFQMQRMAEAKVWRWEWFRSILETRKKPTWQELSIRFGL